MSERNKEERMRVVFVVLLAAALLPVGGTAQTEEKKISAAPQQVHQSGRIRVFYHTDGQHAVDATDANLNHIPDQVEDVLTQTLAAQTMWVEVFGFPDPFETPRFRAAHFLDIHFRHKDVLKSNGVTYDELQHFNRPGDPKDTVSLCFNVATSVKAPANLTPAHEFFHVIQNSVTFFKNSWFTEGTARWSEKALGAGDLGPARILPSWPLPEDKAAAVYAMKYDASENFWNPLCAKLDTDGTLPSSPALQRLEAMRYTDNTPVLKDLRLTGWKFIREVLEGLDKSDDLAFRELGYDRWSEDNQRSPKNNAFIMGVVEEILKKHG
jgi:hypothetical protein